MMNRCALAAGFAGVILAMCWVTALASAAGCKAAPKCGAPVPQWLPHGRLNWAIDYSSALLDGTLPVQGEDAYVLPLSVVATAAAKQATALRELQCVHKAKLICYTNCGAYEPGHWNERLLKPVRGQLFGKPMRGYPEEKWLDIRRLLALRRLIRDKFAKAARLGCDALVCDNTEAWVAGTDGRDESTLAMYRTGGLPAVRELAARAVEAHTGLNISFDDQLRFNRMLAQEAHAQCLAIGLINDVFQIGELAGDFDFALNEQCHHCGWCDLYAPFVRAGKPVFNLEFKDNEGFCRPGSTPMADICAANRSQGLTTFSTIKRAASSKLHLPDRPEKCE